jgi:peptide deformylase
MIRKILQMDQPGLKTPSVPVVDFASDEIKALAQDLLETCLDKEDITAGLSAPQIGVNQQVCVCRRMDLEEAAKGEIEKDKLWEVLINPKITFSSKKQSAYWEGCLSVGVGDDGLYGPVRRPDLVKIEYKDIDGNNKSLDCEGFFAHIVQHELDHLNGIIFLKYIDDPQSIWKCKDLDNYFNKHGEYPDV